MTNGTGVAAKSPDRRGGGYGVEERTRGLRCLTGFIGAVALCCLGRSAAGGQDHVEECLVGALTGDSGVVERAALQVAAEDRAAPTHGRLRTGLAEPAAHLAACATRRGRSLIEEEKAISQRAPDLRENIRRVLSAQPGCQVRSLLAQERWNFFAETVNTLSRYASLVATANLPALVESTYTGLLGAAEGKGPSPRKRKAARIVSEYGIEDRHLQETARSVEERLRELRRQRAEEACCFYIERNDAVSALFFMDQLGERTAEAERVSRQIEELPSYLPEIADFRESLSSLGEEAAYGEFLRAVLTRDRDLIGEAAKQSLRELPSGYVDEVLYACALAERAEDRTLLRHALAASAHPRAKLLLDTPDVNPAGVFWKEMKKRSSEKRRFIFLGEKPGQRPRGWFLRSLYAIYVPGTLIRAVATVFREPCRTMPAEDYARLALDAALSPSESRAICLALVKLYEQDERYESALEVLQKGGVEDPSLIARLRDKAAHCVLLRAIQLREQGEEMKARSGFLYITSTYPETNAATSARILLENEPRPTPEVEPERPLPFGLEFKGGIGSGGLTGYPRLIPRPYEAPDAWLY